MMHTIHKISWSTQDSSMLDPLRQASLPKTNFDANLLQVGPKIIEICQSFSLKF